MILTIRIEPIDQFVLLRVTMVHRIGMSLWVVVDKQWIYVHLDEHIQWLGRAAALDKSRIVHCKYPAISQPGSS